MTSPESGLPPCGGRGCRVREDGRLIVHHNGCPESNRPGCTCLDPRNYSDCPVHGAAGIGSESNLPVGEKSEARHSCKGYEHNATTEPEASREQHPALQDAGGSGSAHDRTAGPSVGSGSGSGSDGTGRLPRGHRADQGGPEPVPLVRKSPLPVEGATITVPMLHWNRAMAVVGAASIFTSAPVPGQEWRKHVRDTDYQRLHGTVAAFDRDTYPMPDAREYPLRGE